MTKIEPKKNNKKILVVVGGATASGKTSLAILLAKYFNTEIVSADSRQFYKELSIGVARPSTQELQEVPHHFIACRSVLEPYAAGAFGKDARECIARIHEQRSIAIMVGGSGLYIQSVIKGFDETQTEIESSLRIELERLFQMHGITALQEKLQELDPGFYQTLDINNPQRMMRAIERVLASGKVHDEIWSGVDRPQENPFTTIEIAIDLPRSELYERINKRVDQMMVDGLVEEAKGLIAYKDMNALKTVGYKEIFSYLNGEMDLNRATELIKQNTRRYAKRQVTWMKHKTDSNWFAPNQLSQIIQLIEGQS